MLRLLQTQIQQQHSLDCYIDQMLLSRFLSDYSDVAIRLSDHDFLKESIV